ncbi:MAG: DegV family protein [Lachnospiraceae bacterium]|nr:DegV family protein [Lachnospiraceae bacterium]
MYTIVTDSSCDLPAELLKAWNVKCANLNFTFDGSEEVFDNDKMPIDEFYSRMRAGGVSRTSAVNTDTFFKIFEPELAEGRDVLYIGFTSGLSTTYNSGAIAAMALAEKYPERTIIPVDTTCASGGEGLMVHYAVQQRDNGASIEENAAFIRGRGPSVCHYVAVDDLMYLKRGGRLSASSAIVGNMLNIKPVILVDGDGHLQKAASIRGRKNCITAIAKKFIELAIDLQEPYVISHADCLEEARFLESRIVAMGGAPAAYLTDMGPVIGSHAGPGTLAVFFEGRERGGVSAAAKVCEKPVSADRRTASN